MFLPKFKFIGRHGINIISGIYLAASLAYLIGKLAPNFQLPAFILFSLVWVLTEVGLIIRELNGDRESLTSLGIGTLPPVIVGSTVVLVIARIIAHYEPGPSFSVLFAEWGLIFWVGGYLVMMRNAYHERKLEEDLAKKAPAGNGTGQSRANGSSSTGGPSWSRWMSTVVTHPVRHRSIVRIGVCLLVAGATIAALGIWGPAIFFTQGSAVIVDSIDPVTEYVDDAPIKYQYTVRDTLCRSGTVIPPDSPYYSGRSVGSSIPIYFRSSQPCLNYPFRRPILESVILFGVCVTTVGTILTAFGSSI